MNPGYSSIFKIKVLLNWILNLKTPNEPLSVTDKSTVEGNTEESLRTPNEQMSVKDKRTVEWNTEESLRTPNEPMSVTDKSTVAWVTEESLKTPNEPKLNNSVQLLVSLLMLQWLIFPTQQGPKFILRLQGNICYSLQFKEINSLQTIFVFCCYCCSCSQCVSHFFFFTQ